jgi:hypothetical protein
MWRSGAERGIKPYNAGRFYYLKHDVYDLRRWLALRWKHFSGWVYERLWP